MPIIIPTKTTTNKDIFTKIYLNCTTEPQDTHLKKKYSSSHEGGFKVFKINFPVSGCA